jgi:hypothetical protein
MNRKEKEREKEREREREKERERMREGGGRMCGREMNKKSFCLYSTPSV